MKEAVEITLGVILIIAIIVGAVTGIVALAEYTPTHISTYYKDSQTTCMKEKPWGFVETKEFCVKGVSN